MAPNLRNKRSNLNCENGIPKKKNRNSKSTSVSFSISTNSTPENSKKSRGRTSKTSKSISTTANSTMAYETTLLSNNTPAEAKFNPETLAHKLEDFCNDIVQNGEAIDCPDLKDFDIENDSEDLEKYRELREELCRKISHFDEEGKTEVNFDTAAIAGAKLLLDEKKATRSMSKKLAEEVGVSEDNLLYHGLNGPSDHLAAQEILEQRTNSLIESFVDFQKQIKFKMNVLNYVAKKAQIDEAQSKSHPRTRRQQKKISPKKHENLRKKMILPKTPKKKRGVDPLAHSRIIDAYALEVASEVVDHSRKPRKIAPIPIDFTILDDENDENLKEN